MSNIPPLHSFRMVMVTGSLYEEMVLGFTITRAEFDEAVASALHTTYEESTHFPELGAPTEESWSAMFSELSSKVHAAAARMSRFPLGLWTTKSGIGCIVAELYAADVARNFPPKEQEFASVLYARYGIALGSTLLDFGSHVDTEITRVIERVTPREVRPARSLAKSTSIIVFIQE